MQVAARFSGEGLAYEGLAYRNSSGAHWTGKVKLIEKHLEDPLRWQRPRRIFVNSMSDLFHDQVPDKWIDRIFAVMASAGWHTFQVLTKRPERMLAYFQQVSAERDMQRWINAGLDMDLDQPSSWEWPLSNVWLGVSCEDQKTADERIPLLIETPAAVRFISAEPLLGPINARMWYCACGWKGSESTLLPSPSTSLVCPECGGSGGLLYRNWLASAEYSREGIDWLIVGGESGPGARAMHPEWARSLRDQCTRAGVPFFFKQWGEWIARGAYTADSAQPFVRLGKKATGRTLDGRTWSEYPKGAEGWIQ
jgi:protein gp37